MAECRFGFRQALLGEGGVAQVAQDAAGVELVDALAGERGPPALAAALPHQTGGAEQQIIDSQLAPE